MSVKHCQIQQYKAEKHANEASIRDLIMANRGMVKHFRRGLERVSQEREALVGHSGAVPGFAAQLQDGPATELSYFLRLPLHTLLRTPDHQMVSDLTVSRLRRRVGALHGLLEALELHPYDSAARVHERVVDLKVDIARREAATAADLVVVDGEAGQLVVQSGTVEKDLTAAVTMMEHKLAALESPLQQALDAMGSSYPEMIRKVEGRLRDFEEQPGQFAADPIYQVGGMGVGDWLLKWDDQRQRNMALAA